MPPIKPKEIINEIKTNIDPKKSPGFDLITEEILRQLPKKDIVKLTYLLISQFSIHQLMHNLIVLKTILKFTLKQLRHVSVQSPSSGSALFDLAKVAVVKIIN
jgi:hypothetical protein